MSIEEARAWMAETGRGYKAAAKKFGLDVSTLRSRAPARAPARESESESAEGWRWARALGGTPVEKVVEVAGGASSCLEGLVPGGRIVGLTAGQFSLLDLIRATLDVTGPASVTLSTWTSGIRDTETAAWLLASGKITAFRMLTDRSFPSRQPAYCRRLIELFGESAVVVTHTHAKFAVIRNERWNVVIRSSMNLNKNRRWEQFDIDDSLEMASMFDEFAELVASEMRSGVEIPNEEVEEGFDAVLAVLAKSEKRARREEQRQTGHTEASKGRLQYLEDLLETIHAQMDEANGNALANLVNSARQVRRQLDDERKAQEDVSPEEAMSDDDLLAALLESIGVFAATAPAYFERVVAEVDRLR